MLDSRSIVRAYLLVGSCLVRDRDRSRGSNFAISLAEGPEACKEENSFSTSSMALLSGAAAADGAGDSDEVVLENDRCHTLCPDILFNGANLPGALARRSRTIVVNEWTRLSLRASG